MSIHINCEQSNLDAEAQFNRRRSSQVAPWTNPKFPDPRAAPLKMPNFPLSPDSIVSSESLSGTDPDISTIPFIHQHLPQYHAIRERLRNYFAKRNRVEQLTKRPWIFLLQFIKLGLITTMAITLSNNNYGIKTAVAEIKETISNLLIPEYADDGVDKVYSFEELDNITITAVGEYFCLSELAISLLGYPNGLDPEYPPPVQVEITHYAEVSIDQNWNVTWNATILTHKETIQCPLCDYQCVLNEAEKFSVKPFEQGLLQYRFQFQLHLLLMRYLSKPHSVNITYHLIFSNSMETGLELDTLMDYELMIKTSPVGGGDTSDSLFDDNTAYYCYIILDISVILISLVSTCAIIRRVSFAYTLYIATRDFIENTYKRHLNHAEKWSFVNYWYICIMIADMLILVSAVLKTLIDINVEYYFDMCTLLLGCGLWLSYLGLLRYLTFSKHYSAIINTIVVAMPHLARFMICVIVVSLAYVLCGWLVLSPYNMKFSTFWLTLETLFSLLNGDDMFNTFIMVETTNSVPTQRAIYIFSKIYLYSYVCFFIYVVLSVCIAMIEDAYDVVSKYRNESCPWFQDPRLFGEFATSWEDYICRDRGVN